MLGKLYIIGGSKELGRQFFPSGCTNVDVVRLDTGEAAAAASLQALRIAPAVASSTSSIFVFGGRHAFTDFSSCELFGTQSAQ